VDGAVNMQTKVRTLEWVRDALEAAGALTRWHAPADVSWTGATIDNRADCSGRLFFALSGERVDGHRFVRDAFAAGSPAVVVSDPAVADAMEAQSIPYFLVRDTRGTLFELARAYRRHLAARVVAITGSGGKTTTKEYVRAVLRAKYRVHANRGNLNSLVGVPLTILEADEHCEYLVCEVGANHLGEIDALGGLLAPDVAAITNIGDAHVGYFGSRAAIADEKGSLLKHLARGGVAVLPRDDEFFEKLGAKVQGRVFSFGRSPAADFRLGNVTFSEGLLRFSVNGEPLSLSAVGEYNAVNACAAFAVGDACGVDARRMRDALASVPATPGRGRVHVVGGVTIIDESYNANPASMAAAIELLAKAEPHSGGRRIAALGDMRELGPESAALHKALSRNIDAARADLVFLCGPNMRALWDALSKKNRGFYAETSAELAPEMMRSLKTGDVVLVKGSFGSRMSVIIEALRARESATA